MRVAHFGTFDVDNYGDLLFPHIIRWRLAGHEVVNVTPTGASTLFRDALPSVAVSELDDLVVDAAVVGGGNIVNARRTPLAAYRSVSRTAYAGLWAGAAAFASERGLPLVFNAPSVSPRRLGAVEGRLLREAVGYASYVAVRDESSRRNIAAVAPARPPSLVPDSAFDLDRMWPSLAGADPSGDYAAVHVNRRYMPSPLATAAALDGLVRDTGLKARLVPIGPCHGDVETARGVAELMQEPREVTPVTSLADMAATNARSSLYVGSSMHGFITALMFGAPALLVLNDSPLEKFGGVLAAAALPTTTVLSSWRDLPSRRGAAGRLTEDARRAIHSALDRHWADLEAALVAPPGEHRTYWLRGWRSLARISVVETAVSHRVVRLLGRGA